MKGAPVDRERAAILASPADPRVEYIPARLAGQWVCRCPHTVIDHGPRSWQLKVLHVGGCTERVAPFGPARSRRPVGVIPCPVCGNVAYSLVDGARRCDGAAGCGHVWTPGLGAVATAMREAGHDA